MTTCPGLSGRVPVYTCCPCTLIIVTLHSHNCPGLSDKLRGHSLQERRVRLHGPSTRGEMLGSHAEEQGLRNGAESRLPDTQLRLYLGDHISSELLPHQLIKKTSLGNGRDGISMASANEHLPWSWGAKPHTHSIMQQGQICSEHGASYIATRPFQKE